MWLVIEQTTGAWATLWTTPLRSAPRPAALPRALVGLLGAAGPLRRINRPPLPERDLRDYRSQDTRRRILDRAAAIGRTLRDAPPDRA